MDTKFAALIAAVAAIVIGVIMIIRIFGIELFLFLALIVSAAIWLADIAFFRPRRVQAGADASAEPLIVEYARAFFPVILVVFVLRSFVIEPFRIPSGSMLPGLQAGDFILVSKSSYGVRFPVFNIKLIDSGRPARGDVAVFRYPLKPSINYIKRVIGLPGDVVVYRDKKIYINGEQVYQQPLGEHVSFDSGRNLHLKEKIGAGEYEILQAPIPQSETLEFHVPDGHYFVMGDNRDNSNDSRSWRYVPERNLVGRAFFVWFSWDVYAARGWPWERVNWNRIGASIK